MRETNTNGIGAHGERPSHSTRHCTLPTRPGWQVCNNRIAGKVTP